MVKESRSKTIVDTGTGSDPLGPIVGLFQALSEQGIGYCHWKSNWNLDQALRGLTDLDLLVERTDSTRFRELLCQLDFKPALSPVLRNYPAMEDYLGFDRDSGRLIHLHIHYQLILGEKSVKGYRLPLEQRFLESDHTYAGVRIPPPELEAIVLTIRAFLKYRGGQFLKSVFSPRHGGMPATVLKELEYLLNQTTVESVSRVIGEGFDLLPGDVVLDSLAAIRANPPSWYMLYRMRGRLRHELAPYQRYRRCQALARNLRAEWASRPRLPFERSVPQKKTLVQGGLTVAVVGADGAGKSTVVNELHKWLSWRLTVHTFYMGSTQPSTITRLAELASRIFGYPYRRSRAVISENGAISKLLRVPQRLFQSIHRIGIAVDRHSRYVAGQRKASQGTLVLYDRYPLEAVRVGDRFMDGPRIASMYRNEMSHVTKALSRVEESIHHRIRMPDHLFVLQVSPSVSLQRKPDHKPEILRVKSQAISEMERCGLRITKINADQPLDQVLAEIKTRMWELL